MLFRSIAQALEDGHLLSGAPRSGSRWYELLADRLIACHTDLELDQGSDHYPTIVRLAAEPQLAPEIRR